MKNIKDKISSWYHTQDPMVSLRMALENPDVRRAFDLALSKNTPQRFELAQKTSNDKIIEQSSMFDQMRGWNDCLNFILSLSLPPKSDLTPQIPQQYDADYVSETYEKHYPTK